MADAVDDRYSFNETWRWAHFTTEDGLPSNRVLDICDARDGTPWVATASGIAWYDGFVWHAVGPEAGLPKAACQRITADLDTGILAVIEDQLYRGDRHGFETVPIPGNGSEHRVLLAAPSGAGGLLLLSRSMRSGLPTHHRLAEGKLHELDGTPGEGQLAFEVPWGTSESEIWVRTAWDLYALIGGSWQDGEMADADAEQSESDGFRSRQGLAWIEGPQAKRGLWSWQEGKSPKLNFRMEFGRLQTVALGPNGVVLAAEDSGPVHIRHGESWTQLDPVPLQFEDVSFLRFRANGDLWIGTHDGLSLYLATSRLWEHWKNPAADGTNRINEILQTRDGTVWIASSDGIEIRRSNGQIEHVVEIDNTDVRHSTGVAEDHAGNVWITSGWSYEGAFRFNGSAWTYFGPERGLPGLRHKVRVDRQGRPWFLGLQPGTDHETLGGTGAAVFTGTQFEHWTTERGLIHDRVYAFAEGLHGELWFGTLGGLSRFHEGQWTHWDTSNGLRAMKVWTLAVDENNVLWFGDEGNGLGVVRGDEPRYLTTADGLPSNQMHDLRSDPLGGIWATYPGGVLRIKGTRRHAISSIRGIGHSPLWPILPTRERVFIGTMGAGTAVLNRGMLEHCPLHVELWGPSVYEESATLRWHAVAYEGLLRPKDIETRHRLDGGEWSNWSGERSTSVALAAGAHTFSVQARNGLAESPSVEKQVAFELPLPLQRQPLFLAFAGGGAAVIAALFTIMTVRRRRHVAALRASEGKTQAILSTAIEGIVTIDERGAIESFNPAAERLFGYRKEEVIGRNVKLLMPPPYSNEHDGYLGRYLRTGERKIIGMGREVTGRRKDGTIFPLELGVSEIRLGQRLLFVGILHDLTRRKQAEEALHRAHDQLEALVRERTEDLQRANEQLKQKIADRTRAEEALRESEERFRQVTENIDEVFWLTDWKNRKLLYVSPAYEAIFGKSLQSLLEDRHSWKEDIHPEDRDRIAETFAKSAELGLYVEEEYRLVRPDGSIRWIRDRAFPIRDQDGQVSRIVGVADDITRRKLVEEEKDTLSEQLHQAQKMQAVGQLAAGVAHDFNNLLMVILGRCEQAKNLLPATSAALEALAEAEMAAMKARDLTDSLLTFSRHMPAKMKPLNLCETVEESCDLIRRTLTGEIKLELSTCTPPVWMNADSTRLHQLVLNLALNGRDAMPDGGTLRISVAPASESEIGQLAADSPPQTSFGCLTVADTGQGMSPEISSRILEPFYTTKPRGQGTGLGLSIVHGIVQEHSGRLQIETEPGKGSTFRFVAPCLEPGAVPEDSAPANDVPGNAGDLILLASGDTQQRGLISSTLQRHGYEVIKTSDAESLGEAYRRHGDQVRLLVIDLDWLEHPKLDCLKEMRQNGGGAAVILITGAAGSSIGGSWPGETMLLQKPFQMSDLARLVSDFLQNHSGPKESG